MYTDPIADLLTRIRNAARADHKSVTIPASKMKKAIAEILAEYNFIEEVEVVKEGKFDQLLITLRPEQHDIMLQRKSKPGRRKYVAAGDIRSVRNGYGIGIVSTSQGLMTANQAKEKGIGGEYLCEVY